MGAAPIVLPASSIYFVIVSRECDMKLQLFREAKIFDFGCLLKDTTFFIWPNFCACFLVERMKCPLLPYCVVELTGAVYNLHNL